MNVRFWFVAVVACCALGAIAQIPGDHFVLRSRPVRLTSAQLMRLEALAGTQPATIRPQLIPPYRAENPQSPFALPWASLPPSQDKGSGQMGSGRRERNSIGVSFGGPQYSESLATLPLPSADVSLSSILIATDGRLRAYDRAGNPSGLNVSLNTAFSSVRSAGMTSPHIIFDRIMNRWFIQAVDTAAPSNNICLGVSDGEVISPSTVWTFYSFSQNIGSGGYAGFGEATMGVDANGIYIATNRFSTAGVFLNTDVFAIRKRVLVNQGVLDVTSFRNLAIVGGAGVYSPVAVTNDDSDATSALVIGSDLSQFGVLAARRITHDTTSFTISSNIAITVPTTSLPNDAPILLSGGTGSIEAGDDRISEARMSRNPTTGASGIIASHSIAVNASGVGTTTGNRNAIRWYRIQNYTTSPTLSQSGTAYDGTTGTFDFPVAVSAASNGQGNMVMGCTISNATISPGVGGSVQNWGGATTTGLSQILAGTNYYNLQSGTNPKNWGTGSTTVVDPRNNQSFWTFQEYCNANNSWQIRAMQILLAPPTITLLSPSTAQQGQTLNVTLTGTGFFDPGAGYPDRLTVVSNAGITVNAVSWSSATSVVANITISSSAAPGPRNLTLTNPDGQSVASALLVTQAPITYTGTISSLGVNVSNELYTFTFKKQSTGDVLDTLTAYPDSAGHFTIQSMVSGSFRLSVKTRKRLSDSADVSSTSGISVTSRPGDTNNDDTVDLRDFSKLSSYYGLTDAASNWNTGDSSGVAPAHCDWNNDGKVNLIDFSLLSTHYGQSGTP